LLEGAHRAQQDWARRPLRDRTDTLRALARVLRTRVDAFARLAAVEMGKPLAQGRAEVEKCAVACEYYAEHAESMLRDEIVATEFADSRVAFRPLGVILCIMPWNFPFWQVVRFAAPALAAGNAVLLKHAPTTWGCGLALVEAFHEAGVPHDVMSALMIDVPDVARVIADARVRGVTFTGSTRGGSAVAALAGAHVKRSVLELGGSDAYVVLDDADLEIAARACSDQRCTNAGQSCIAAKRWIVDRSVMSEFTERVVTLMRAQTMGDPLEEGTRMGPLARRDLRDGVHAQVLASVAAGARIACGGEVPAERGWFYPATVLTNVDRADPAAREEVFGPVAALIGARDTSDAIAIANDSVYGLGAAVFGADVERAQHVARQLDAGSVFVNTFARSDVRLPFGGVKDSGYGRELGVYGLREFVNITTLVTA
jgi:succinate-semialdehyde dehydrogenase/glutarate-semialdehyde dehydrogenase